MQPDVNEMRKMPQFVKRFPRLYRSPTNVERLQTCKVYSTRIYSVQKNCNWKHYSAFNFWSSIILKNVKKPNYLTIQRQHIHFAYGTWENNTHKQTYIKYVILISCILNVRFIFISLLSYYTTTTVTTLRPLYTSTCVSRHLQLRTGKFCWYTTPKIMRDIEHQSRPGFF